MAASLPGSISTEITDNLRSLTAGSWSSSKKEVIAYRDAVLEAQQFRCAYCQRKIIRNELGHRELDHILPKSQNPKKGIDAMTASSNLRGHRRHTTGYPAFRYEPHNLVITCKRCNAFKGSYDCLADRSAAPLTYPQSSDDFEWVHPYHDDYFVYLKIENDVIFQSVNGSEKGNAVIDACGLNKIEEVIERAVADHVAEAIDTGLAMMNVIFRESVFNAKTAAEEIIAVHGKGDVSMIADCLIDLQASLMMGTGQLKRVLDAFIEDLSRSSPSWP